MVGGRVQAAECRGWAGAGLTNRSSPGRGVDRSGGASLRQVSTAAGTEFKVHALLRLEMSEDAE